MNPIDEDFTIIVEVGGYTESTYFLHAVIDVPCLEISPYMSTSFLKYFHLDVNKIKWVLSVDEHDKKYSFSEVIDCSRSSLYVQEGCSGSQARIMSLQGNWKLMLIREIKDVVHDLEIIGRSTHYELRIIKA
jgi:hypothetical protein